MTLWFTNQHKVDGKAQYFFLNRVSTEIEDQRSNKPAMLLTSFEKCSGDVCGFSF